MLHCVRPPAGGRGGRTCGRLVWLFLVGLIMGLPGARAVSEDDLLPGIDDRWNRYASPNFELYCDQSDKEARAILRDLELLRAVFFGQIGFRETARLDVTIYAFRSQREFEAYTPKGDSVTKTLAGLYVARPDRAVILLRPMEDRLAARRVAFHEYVHHLFKAVGEDPPLWFNEGMAELLAGIKLEGDNLTIGHPVVDRLLSLQHEKLIPLGELFAVGPGSKYYQSKGHTGLFYAQSWALLHYWRFGKSKLDPAAVDRFLRVAGDRKALARTNVQSLFEECFKMDYDHMLRDLGRYVRRGSYQFGSVPLPDIPDPSTYAKAAVSRGQIRERLAELALRVDRSAAGTFVLLTAANQPDPEARIFETLGADAWAHEETEKALEYWDRAVTAGSTNSAVLREVATYEWSKWFAEPEPRLRLPEDAADRLRTLLVAAIQAEPDMETGYEMLSWVEACAEKPSAVNINAVQKQFGSMRNKGKTLLALALCRARLDRKAEAIELIKKIGRFDPDPWTLRLAEQSLAQLEGRSLEEISLVRDRNSVRTGAARMTKNVTALPSVPVPADL